MVLFIVQLGEMTKFSKRERERGNVMQQAATDHTWIFGRSGESRGPQCKGPNIYQLSYQGTPSQASFCFYHDQMDAHLDGKMT